MRSSAGTSRGTASLRTASASTIFHRERSASSTAFDDAHFQGGHTGERGGAQDTEPLHGFHLVVQSAAAARAGRDRQHQRVREQLPSGSDE